MGRKARQFTGASKTHTAADLAAHDVDSPEAQAILDDITDPAEKTAIKNSARTMRNKATKTPEEIEAHKKSEAEKGRKLREEANKAREEASIAHMTGQPAGTDAAAAGAATGTATGAPTGVAPVPDVGSPPANAFIASVGSGTYESTNVSSDPREALAALGRLSGSKGAIAMPTDQEDVLNVTRYARPAGGGGKSQTMVPVGAPETRTLTEWMEEQNSRGGVDKNATAVENLQDQVETASSALWDAIVAGSKKLPGSLRALSAMYASDDPDSLARGRMHAMSLIDASPALAQEVVRWHGVTDPDSGEVLKPGHGTYQAELETHLRGGRNPTVVTRDKVQRFPRGHPLANTRLPILVNPPDHPQAGKAPVYPEGHPNEGQPRSITTEKEHQDAMNEGAVPWVLPEERGDVFQGLHDKLRAAKVAEHVEKNVGSNRYDAGLLQGLWQRYTYRRPSGPEDMATTSLMAASNASAASMLDHLATPQAKERGRFTGGKPADEVLHKHLDTIEKATGTELNETEVKLGSNGLPVTGDQGIRNAARRDVEQHPIYGQMLDEIHGAHDTDLVSKLASYVPGVDLSTVAQHGDLAAQLQAAHEIRNEEYKNTPGTAVLGGSRVTTEQGTHRLGKKPARTERGERLQTALAGERDPSLLTERQRSERQAYKDQSLSAEDEQEFKPAEPEEVSLSKEVPLTGEEAEQERAEKESQELESEAGKISGEQDLLKRISSEGSDETEEDEEDEPKRLSEGSRRVVLKGAQAVRHAALREARADIFRQWSQLPHVKAKIGNPALESSLTEQAAAAAAAAAPKPPPVAPEDRIGRGESAASTLPAEQQLNLSDPQVAQHRAERETEAAARAHSASLEYAGSILRGNHLHSDAGVRWDADINRSLMKTAAGWAPQVGDYETELRRAGGAADIVNPDVPEHVMKLPEASRPAALLGHWMDQKVIRDEASRSIPNIDPEGSEQDVARIRGALSPEEHHRASSWPGWVDAGPPGSPVKLTDDKPPKPTGNTEPENPPELNPSEAVLYSDKNRDPKLRGTVRTPAATPYSAENPMGERLSMSQIGEPMAEAPPVASKIEGTAQGGTPRAAAVEAENVEKWPVGKVEPRPTGHAAAGSPSPAMAFVPPTGRRQQAVELVRRTISSMRSGRQFTSAPATAPQPAVAGALHELAKGGKFGQYGAKALIDYFPERAPLEARPPGGRREGPALPPEMQEAKGAAIKQAVSQGRNPNTLTQAEWNPNVPEEDRRAMHGPVLPPGLGTLKVAAMRRAIRDRRSPFSVQQHEWNPASAGFTGIGGGTAEPVSSSPTTDEDVRPAANLTMPAPSIIRAPQSRGTIRTRTAPADLTARSTPEHMTMEEFEAVHGPMDPLHKRGIRPEAGGGIL